MKQFCKSAARASSAVCLILLLVIISAFTAPGTARAEDPLNPKITPVLPPDLPKLGGQILPKAACFKISSDAPFPLYGSFMTNRYVTPQSGEAQHRFNFRLATGQTQQICTEGPFFEGQQLDLTLRALVPMFSCRTAIYGTINMHGRKKPDGSNEMWADCLIPKE